MTCLQMLQCRSQDNCPKSCDSGSNSHDKKSKSHDIVSGLLCNKAMSLASGLSCDIGVTCASEENEESDEVMSVASSLACWCVGAGLTLEEERKVADIEVHVIHYNSYIIST